MNKLVSEYKVRQSLEKHGQIIVYRAVPLRMSLVKLPCDLLEYAA